MMNANAAEALYWFARFADGLSLTGYFALKRVENFSAGKRYLLRMAEEQMSRRSER